MFAGNVIMSHRSILLFLSPSHSLSFLVSLVFSLSLYISLSPSFSFFLYLRKSRRNNRELHERRLREKKLSCNFVLGDEFFF